MRLISEKETVSRNSSDSLGNQRVLFGPVHLRVTNLEKSLRFWKSQIGLTERLSTTAGAVELGSDSRTLIILNEGASTPRSSGYAGLYHLALHVSSEAEFAGLISLLFERQVPFSPVDHLLSKSIYLTDPDGIGLEFTFETPERGKLFGLDSAGYPLMTDRSGRRHSGRGRLDLGELMRNHPAQPNVWSQPDSVHVGHIHLSVPNLARVRDHYMNLGFEISFHSEAIGMVELHTGGDFTHQLVLNNWQGPDAKPSPSDMAGLDYFTLIDSTDSSLHSEVAHRDPAGNQYTFTNKTKGN